MICSIDFSKNIEMYNAFKESPQIGSKLKQYLIFDDTQTTVWIIWQDGDTL
jgi:hypothetical protein